jgi:hypothetical protein
VSLKIHWPSEAESPTARYRALGLQEAGLATSDLPLGVFRGSALRSQAMRWMVIASALSFVGWRLWIFALSSALRPADTIDVLLDDAYYYLQIAYNIGIHGRSTFDGVTSTNGYQPAWMVLLIAIESVLRLDKKALYVAMQGLILVTTAGPLLFCLRRHRDPFYLGLAAGLLAAYAAFPGVFLAGLETALFAPAIVAVAHLNRTGFRSSARQVSWVFAGIVLIRLDAASLLVAYGAALGISWWRSAGLFKAVQRLARFVAPAALSLGVYALINELVYGQAVPVSGMAKGIGAPLFSNWGILHHYLFNFVPVAMLGTVVLAIELLWTKFEGGARTYGALGILVGATAVHYFYFAAFSGWIPWPWYFYGYALMIVLLAARLAAIASERLARPVVGHSRTPAFVAAGAIALASLVFPGFVHYALGQQMLTNHRQAGVPDGSFNRRNAADALRLAESGKPVTIAIGDRAAGLGYWAPDNVKVFAMEGLVSDKTFLEARQHDQGEAWVRERIRPDFLVVDREELEPVELDGERRYVVIEPIQGRVVLDHLLTYCFREDAVVRRELGRDNQLTVLNAPAARTTFDMSKAEPCTGAFAQHVRDRILSTESLRRSGVATEYAPYVGGDLNAALERFDRELALSRRGATKRDAIHGAVAELP